MVAIYSTFLQRAYDQIIHDVCLQKLPVVFALDRGGLVGEDGETHQGVYDLTYLRCIPNMTVMAPADESEFRNMLFTALEHDGPIALRYPRGNGEGVSLEKGFRKIPIGKGEILELGRDYALLAVGRMVGVAKAVALTLKKEGLQGTVANMRFVKPLDEALILSLAHEHKVLLTMEENVLTGGFGSGVLEVLQKPWDHGLRGPSGRHSRQIHRACQPQDPARTLWVGTLAGGRRGQENVENPE